MIVDAHHHVWRIARGDYAWMRPDMPIYRDFSLDDLRPLLGDVTATVLVQAAATEAETGFMLETARASGGLVRGVVGWVAMEDHNATARIAAMAREPLLKGFRPMLQDIEDTDWILRPEVQPALTALRFAGLRLDLLVKPRHLPILPTLAERHPDLAMVIDHAAKPDIAQERFRPWADGMARLARDTNWYCKLSGLVTEARADWQTDDLRRYVDHLLDCFGPTRLMWGSDWPVVNLAGGYARWRAATLQLLPAECREAVLGDTAAAFYGL